MTEEQKYEIIDGCTWETLSISDKDLIIEASEELNIDLEEATEAFVNGDLKKKSMEEYIEQYLTNCCSEDEEDAYIKVWNYFGNAQFFDFFCDEFINGEENIYTTDNNRYVVEYTP